MCIVYDVVRFLLTHMTFCWKTDLSSAYAHYPTLNYVKQWFLQSDPYWGAACRKVLHEAGNDLTSWSIRRENWFQYHHHYNLTSVVAFTVLLRKSPIFTKAEVHKRGSKKQWKLLSNLLGWKEPRWQTSNAIRWRLFLQSLGRELN